MEPAVSWFQAASYGRFTYQLDFTSSWHRINADSSAYADNTRSGAAHLEYLQAAVSAADPVVDFSRYDVIYVMVPSALHTVVRHANNPIEADHGRLKARLRPMRGLKRHRSARILAAGHAFVQNLRRGHYDIATEVPTSHRLRIAFDHLALTI